MARIKKFFLIDQEHNKKHIYLMKAWETLSKIVLFEGYRKIFAYEDRIIHKYWNHTKKPPSYYFFKTHFSIKNVKYYLHNSISIDDPIWNPDFLNGITVCGVKIHAKTHFNVFRFNNLAPVEELLESCPFPGEKDETWKRGNRVENYRWKSPSLSLKFSEKTISFMAGVLATGKIEVVNGQTYIKYNQKVAAKLREWKIPIEITESKFPFRVYISPFWATLFTPWMPPCSQKFLDVKKPFKAKEYALIMWRVFGSKKIATEAIPFLMCRRSFFIHYGKVQDFERIWVEQKLTEIDSRVGKAIQYWKEKLYNKLDKENKENEKNEEGIENRENREGEGEK